LVVLVTVLKVVLYVAGVAVMCSSFLYCNSVYSYKFSDTIVIKLNLVFKIKLG
jgi:hypothetical protein